MIRWPKSSIWVWSSKHKLCCTWKLVIGFMIIWICSISGYLHKVTIGSCKTCNTPAISHRFYFGFGFWQLSHQKLKLYYKKYFNGSSLKISLKTNPITKSDRIGKLVQINYFPQSIDHNLFIFLCSGIQSLELHWTAITLILFDIDVRYSVNIVIKLSNSFIYRMRFSTLSWLSGFYLEKLLYETYKIL